jgi:hypothetical protein
VAEFPLTRAKTAQRLRNAGRIFKLAAVGECAVLLRALGKGMHVGPPGRGRLTGVLDVVCFWHLRSRVTCPLRGQLWGLEPTWGDITQTALMTQLRHQWAVVVE